MAKENRPVFVPPVLGKVASVRALHGTIFCSKSQLALALAPSPFRAGMISFMLCSTNINFSDVMLKERSEERDLQERNEKGYEVRIVSLSSTVPCSSSPSNMIDIQDLGFFANLLGIWLFVLVVASYFVVAYPKVDTQ